MKRRFIIDAPEQLKVLAELTQDSRASVARVARIWQAERARRGDTPWDGAIYACFSGDRTREARLCRITSGGQMVAFAPLKYNLALEYCAQRLRPIYD